jgi:hypothetical protein
VTRVARLGADTATAPGNDVPITGVSGASGSQTWFERTVPSGQTRVVFSISGGTARAARADHMWNTSLWEISYPLRSESDVPWTRSATAPRLARRHDRSIAGRPAAPPACGARAAARRGSLRDRPRVGWHPALDAKWGASPHETTHAHTPADAVPTRRSSYPTATRSVFH